MGSPLVLTWEDFIPYLGSSLENLVGLKEIFLLGPQRPGEDAMAGRGTGHDRLTKVDPPTPGAQLLSLRSE